MKPLYTPEEFNNAKSKDLLPIQCYHCGKPCLKTKQHIMDSFSKSRTSAKYCSKECSHNSRKLIQPEINCTNCNTLFKKSTYEIKKSKSGNHFCSLSCTAIYHNNNKTHGSSRSKLELWLEEQLTILYPNLHIDFNIRTIIGSELDIYIPSLNIAFEINGIFHYEPIFGVNNLEHVQSKDISKSKACFDAKIDLCIIDVSAQKYFKPKTSQKYLDIITKIINERSLS